MVLLWMLLLGSLSTFNVGVFTWAVIRHVFSVRIPSALQHPIKFRFLHCVALYIIALGNILQKLRICSMPRFIQFFHDTLVIKKNHNLVVTNLKFGTIPVRLFQPKALSSELGGHHLLPWRGHHMWQPGYRKLPDYHHPCITMDCLNASIHFMKSLTTYGVDPSRVIACGESIGGGAVAIVIQTLLSYPSLPKICAQVLVTPAMQIINFSLPSHQQNENVPFLTKDILMLAVCGYLDIDLSWKDAIRKGTSVPPDTWKKYKKWLSSDNIPRKFKSKSFVPESPGPFNEAAYLETKHVFDAEISPLLVDDKIIAQLPKTFLVSCENDPLQDDALLYKKRLEDQGVPVSWYHVEDGFHGCIVLFDKQPFSFPCSTKIANAVVSYIKGI